MNTFINKFFLHCPNPHTNISHNSLDAPSISTMSETVIQLKNQTLFLKKIRKKRTSSGEYITQIYVTSIPAYATVKIPNRLFCW